jgi:hypothetical protein
MPSDRARVTYDPTQQYRSVVMQQGRVTLEADWNEAELISKEETREEALDFVGPSGTPDDGYRITPGANFDFQIQAGTMYVGGIRQYLPANATYFNQPDWLLPPGPDPTPPVNEYIYLYLLEQEISAVEDSDLKDVALGGPDTAQRGRILQQVQRTATSASTCPDAFAEAQKKWIASGLEFQPATMRLQGTSQLKVGFDPAGGTSNPCQPAAQSGFLGAFNQLIRVQITGPNTFVWGYDNASFLYQITQVLPDNQTVQLKTRPVDAFHQPAAGQVVEVTRATAKLANGALVAYSASLDNVTPGTFNIFGALAAGYNPGDQTVQLGAALSGDFLDIKKTPALFLRVWQEQLTFTVGTPISLGTTGVQVTLQPGDSGVFHFGDFWNFAVRPSTASVIYPERYQNDFQLPEGPRQWVCPLAVVGWTGTPQILADCRNPFDNLVTLTKRKAGGCCTINLQPGDLNPNNTLQSVIDKQKNNDFVTICLAPGDYILPGTLKITKAHSNLTIEACAGGVNLIIDPLQVKNAIDGVILIDGASNVKLCGLTLVLRDVGFGQTTRKFAGLNADELRGVAGRRFAEIFIALGVRALSASDLTICNCDFVYPKIGDRDVYFVGILAAGAISGLRIRNNRFTGSSDLTSAGTSNRLLYGYQQAPISTFTSKLTENFSAVSGSVLPSTLDDAVFEENYFTLLTSGVDITAGFGVFEFRENKMDHVTNGVNLQTQTALTNIGRLLDQTPPKKDTITPVLQTALKAVYLDPKFQMSELLARALPLPASFDRSQEIVVKGGTPVRSGIIELEVVESKVSTTPAKASAAKPFIFGSGPVTSQFDPFFLHLAVLEQIGLSIFAVGIGANVSFHFLGNDIDSFVSATESGTAFSLTANPDQVATSLTMTANRLRNLALQNPTVQIIAVARATITGNHMINENVDDKSHSLMTSSTRGAVTGNVVKGQPLYPARPASTPVVTWDFFNLKV